MRAHGLAMCVRRAGLLFVSVSVVVFCCTLVLLARQCVTGDELQACRGRTELDVQSCRGILCCNLATSLPAFLRPIFLHQEVVSPGDSEFWCDPWMMLAFQSASGRGFDVHLLDVRVGYAHSHYGVWELCVQLPLWLMLFLASIGPLQWLRRRMSSRVCTALRPCPNCGYDTRANAVRCSECGTPVAGAVTEFCT